MQNKKLKIFIIAGEVSGDVMGAKIMREMPHVEFVGIGGENMIAAGLDTLFPISDLAVMGVFEVLARAKTLTARIQQAADAIVRVRPDIVLTIDSPSFAKRVIKKVRHNCSGQKKLPKFYHVVAPQVWAWGEKRAKKFAKIFDRLYAFFDFEVPYFTRYGLPTIAVGHPIADKLFDYKKNDFTKSEKIITLIPGSRMSEVKRLLPIFKKVTRQLHAQSLAYKFAIPMVETTKDYLQAEIKEWPVRPTLVPASDRYELYKKTYIAIAASGTVSAELAIMHVPAIIVYKMNALTTFLARLLVRVKWASLVNILLNKTVYPELLGRDATPENIIHTLDMLSNPYPRNCMIKDLESADSMWRRDKHKSAVKLIVEDIMKTI